MPTPDVAIPFKGHVYDPRTGAGVGGVTVQIYPINNDGTFGTALPGPVTTGGNGAYSLAAAAASESGFYAEKYTDPTGQVRWRRSDISLQVQQITGPVDVNGNLTAPLPAGSIMTAHLADALPGEGRGIATAKLIDASVTEPKLADGAVTANKLGPNAVTAAKIADGSIPIAKLTPAVATAGDLTTTNNNLAATNAALATTNANLATTNTNLANTNTALGGKLDKTGGTISGNLTVTGTVNAGAVTVAGSPVLTVATGAGLRPVLFAAPQVMNISGNGSQSGYAASSYLSGLPPEAVGLMVSGIMKNSGGVGRVYIQKPGSTGGSYTGGIVLHPGSDTDEAFNGIIWLGSGAFSVIVSVGGNWGFEAFVTGYYLPAGS